MQAFDPRNGRVEDLPDFIIIGAMKCGTSTLAAQLSRQPGIFMCVPKEPNYFSDDSVYARGSEWYRSLFQGVDDACLKGEASTHYTKLPTYPSTVCRMQALLKEPRLVYIIRDPIKRAISHYIHDCSMGIIKCDFEKALERHCGLVDYGRYAYQIAPYLEAYGRESIFITSLEVMQRDPQGVLQQVSEFIGFPEVPQWDESRAHENVSAERIRRFPLHKLLIDNPVAGSLRRALVPKSVRERIRRARQMNDLPQVTENARDRLERVFAEDFDLLRTMFPACAHLAASYSFLTSETDLDALWIAGR